MFRFLIAAAMLCGLSSSLLAQEAYVGPIDTTKPATYLLTVGADGAVSLNPIRLVRPGSPLPPPVDPTPTNPLAAFEAEVQLQAKTALDGGGSLTTGAAFSEVYSLVSDGITSGAIDHTRSLEAVNTATAFVLAKSPDGLKWSAFELQVRNALQKLDSQGQLRTKEDYARVLKAVSNGINKATGYKNLGRSLLAMDLSTTAKVAAAVKANGILDGIDLVKLMELIKFIMELFKFFAPK